MCICVCVRVTETEGKCGVLCVVGSDRRCGRGTGRDKRTSHYGTHYDIVILIIEIILLVRR